MSRRAVARRVRVRILLGLWIFSAACSEPGGQERGGPGSATPSARTGLQWEQPDFAITVENGDEVEPGEFPYIAALLDDPGHGSKKRLLCGGLLIDPNWVLSAAHCLTAGLSEGDKIVMNTVGLATSGSAVVRVVDRWETCNWVKADEYHNDIVMIRLKSGVQAGETPPASLGEVKPGSGTVVGWGLTSGSSLNVSKVLLKAEVPILEASQCDAVLGLLPVKDWSRSICAGGDDRGPCDGDSGGPLIQNGSVVGLVSRTNPGGCTGSDPAVYTRIQAFKPWIESVLAGNPDCDLS